MSHILAIIPMAWKPTNAIHASYNNLPDGMIPINSKPVIGHILDDLLSRGLVNALILLNLNDDYTEKYVRLRYTDKLSITFVYISSKAEGLLWSISEGVEKVDTSEFSSIFIYLGDTIYKGVLDFSSDFLTVSDKYTDSSSWCFIEDWKYINKPYDYHWNGKLLSGLYFFSDIFLFLKLIHSINSGELFLLLEKYSEFKEFNLIPSDWWYDIWNIDNYYKAKIDFLKIRSFNSVLYNDTYWTIRKSSSNTEKIKQEINWYVNMPYDMKIFSPRLVNYELWNNPSYEIEYYGYQSLWDLFLFWYLSENVWKSIIEKLFSTLDLFHEYKSKQPFWFFYEMYYTKTIQRIDAMLKNPILWNLYEMDEIIINNISYKNIKYFISELENWTQLLYKQSDVAFLHGDFCLSNILYDTSNKIIKMIDPRWYFWEIWVYWDMKYDYAKLRHSFVWFYDFIVSDLFKITTTSGWYDFKIFTDPLHWKVSSYFDEISKSKVWNCESIKLIEALLFLTMIPLHTDNVDRQKAMYFIAVQKFNSINYNILWK